MKAILFMISWCDGDLAVSFFLSLLSFVFWKTFPAALLRFSFEMLCKCLHSPKFIFSGKPEVQWLASGKPITDSDDFKYQNAGDIYKLIVGEIFPEDAGVYTCTATNAGGTASSSATIFVKGTWSRGCFCEGCKALVQQLLLQIQSKRCCSFLLLLLKVRGHRGCFCKWWVGGGVCAVSVKDLEHCNLHQNCICYFLTLS